MDTVKSYKGQTSTHCYFLPWTLFFCPPWPQQRTTLPINEGDTHKSYSTAAKKTGHPYPIAMLQISQALVI